MAAFFVVDDGCKFAFHFRGMRFKKADLQPTEQQFNGWLNTVFSMAPFDQEEEHCVDSAEAIIKLTGLFAYSQFKSKPKLLGKVLAAIKIDHLALIAAVKRFQRDVYGVAKFYCLVDNLKSRGQITEDAAGNLCSEVCRLGLRITASIPRKTRIPAAFSLWMCALKPIRVESAELPEVEPESLLMFCAMANFFMTTSYLGKYGDIDMGGDENDERKKRYHRVCHDFTYRDLNFSSLEFFYSSIFRIKKGIVL